MRRLTVIFENGLDCELDRTTVDVPDSESPDDAVDIAVHDAIENWILSAGDVIRIVE